MNTSSEVFMTVIDQIVVLWVMAQVLLYVDTRVLQEHAFPRALVSTYKTA